MWTSRGHRPWKRSTSPEGSAAHHEHLETRPGLARLGCLCRLGPDLGVAVVAGAPDRRDVVPHEVVRAAVTERAAQVVAVAGEEAGVEPSLGGEPGPGAVAAERLGHR